MRYKRLNSFRMHYVQPRYLVSACVCHTRGEGVGYRLVNWSRSVEIGAAEEESALRADELAAVIA